jgi:hypothetical protein
MGPSLQKDGGQAGDQVWGLRGNREIGVLGGRGGEG